MSYIASYSGVRLTRGTCPKCSEDTLIIDSKTQCCSAYINEKVIGYKIISQPVGKRKLPSLHYRRTQLSIQNNKCYYCKREFGFELRIQWDHYIPFSFLQDNPENNFVAACQYCNRSKSNKFNYEKKKRSWSRNLSRLPKAIQKSKSSTSILSAVLPGTGLEKKESKSSDLNNFCIRLSSRVKRVLNKYSDI